MFGYPSGLGALLVRKDASKLLNKVYFGGGAVDYCTAEDVWHVFSPLPAGVWQGCHLTRLWLQTASTFDSSTCSVCLLWCAL